MLPVQHGAPTQVQLPLVIFLFLLLCACVPGSSSERITVEEAWARPVPAESGVGGSETHDGAPHGGDDVATGITSAAYMRLRNHSSSDDRLVSVNADIATIELHHTTHDDGIARMAQLTDGLVVPARGSVALEPGSYHLMLINLQRPLDAGDTFDVTLTFENAGEVTVPVTVRDP